MSGVVVVRIPRQQLAKALGLPEGSEIKAFATNPESDRLVLFVDHPGVEASDLSVPTPEVTLDDLRAQVVK